MSGVINFPITDHLPIFAIFKNQLNPFARKQDENNDRFWRFIDEKKKDKFLNVLEGKLAEINLSEHPEKILTALTDATKASMDSCFPEKKLSNRAKKRALIPWYDSQIFKDEKRQARLWRRFVKSGNPDDHKIYKSFRNKLSKKKYRAKRAFYHDLLEDAKNSGDRSATWDVINKAFGRKKKNRICPEKVVIGVSPNQRESECQKDIANSINNHFSSVAKKLAKKLKKTSLKPLYFMAKENNSFMHLRSIEEAEILEEIWKICTKKAMGYDGIPPKIIKWAATLFAPILKVIFNKCIELGYYPSAMKIAKVSPIHKDGDKNDLNNYRPISVLTQFNQLFERLLSKRYLDFFEKFNLITKKQFGFLKKHCTEHAILDLKEYILGKLEKREVTAVLFLDLQKAFDTVDHKILLKKLYHYGVRGNAYRLLSSYLSDRKQFTKIGDFLSDFAYMLWGVPQGSVLGPLLFLIFINDLPNSCALFSWLFADDTALALSSPNYHDLEVKFNSEVNNLHDWLLANGLSVHYTDKTKYMLVQGPRLDITRVGVKENFKLFMGDHEIEKTDKYKYLGIIFDHKLNWKLQINKLVSKLSSVCGIISKVRHYLDRKSLMLIYNSLFDSRLRYGLLGWGTASGHDIHKLKVLQNRVVRFITFSPFRTKVAALYSELKILPLKEMMRHQRAIFMHCLHYKSLPFMLSCYCQQSEQSQNTRGQANMNYIIPVVKTVRGQTSIKYTGPKAWGEVPKALKDVAFRKPFSKGLKKHILEENFVDLPKQTNTKGKHKGFEDLKRIFETEDENEFFGFESKTADLDDLRRIFETEDESDFFGFESETVNLKTIFLSDDETSEFLGFESENVDPETTLSSDDETEFLGLSGGVIDLNYLFSTSDTEEEFYGFH